jgi:nucleoside-diphosphate-sugar epimerase
MKELVIGSMGNRGRLVVDRLLEYGHEVTAFARCPSAITQTRDRLRVVQGDARDVASLDRAVASQAAVVAAFGPRTLAKSDVQEVFMRNLVAAMQHHGVRRLVNLSSWGSGGAAVPPDKLVVRYFLLSILLRHLLADKRRARHTCSPATSTTRTSVPLSSRTCRRVDMSVRRSTARVSSRSFTARIWRGSWWNSFRATSG